MSFLSSLRRSANNAQFEARRLLRVQQQQNVIAGLQNQREQQAIALGDRTAQKLRESSLQDDELRQLAQPVLALDAQIELETAELQRIQTEEPPEQDPADPAPPAAGQQTTSTPETTCSNCGTALSPTAKFCTGCGTPVDRSGDAEPEQATSRPPSGPTAQSSRATDPSDAGATEPEGAGGTETARG